MVDISLFWSQVGFVTAYVYFIASQVMSIVDAADDITLSDSWKWVFLPVCFAIFYPLVLVRKIEPFAKFHVFGDVMIWITIAVCVGYAIRQDVDQGFSFKNAEPPLKAFNAA